MSHEQDTRVHEEVRQSILDAVGHLLGRYGYSKMTVEDIAHEAGIGKGTMYLHFPSKLEAALSWFDRSNQKLQARMRKVAESDAPPARKVRGILIDRVMHRFDAAQSFVESLEELFVAVRPSFFARRASYHETEEQILAEALSDGKSKGDFSFDDPQATAHAMVLATNSLLPYSLSVSQLGRRKEIEASATRIAELMLTGLLQRSQTRTDCNCPGDKL